MKHPQTWAALTLALAAGSVCGSDLYFSDSTQQNMYWSYQDGWKANSGTARIPTIDDTVAIDSKYVSAEHPLEIRSGDEAVCASFRLSTRNDMSYRTDGRILGLKMSGGTFRTQYDVFQDQSFSIGDCANSYAIFTMTGGIVSNQTMAIGYAGLGVMTNAGGRVVIHSRKAGSEEQVGSFWLGYTAGSTGMVVQTAGSIESLGNAGLRIGHGGTGRFELRGGSVSCPIVVGRNGGDGHLLVADDGQLKTTRLNVGYYGTGSVRVAAPVSCNGQDWFLGYTQNGRGVINVESDVWLGEGQSVVVAPWGYGEISVSDNLTTGYLKIGGQPGSIGKMTVNGANTTVYVYKQLCVSGCTMNEPDLPSELKGGFGELRIRGGTVMVTRPAEGTTSFMYVGRFKESFGRLVGYGKVSPSSDGATNLRMSLGSGQVIGDGEGIQRALDLHQVVSVTPLFENPANCTNGWFAINTGAVLYPRTWFDKSSSSVTRSIGTDGKREGDPDLVNSVKATFTGIVNDNNYFRGGVFASDRDDVYAANLPKSKHPPLAMWKLGLFEDLNSTTQSKQNFTDVTLKFRYDQTKVPRHCVRLNLLRWNGTKWKVVGSVNPRCNPACVISTTAALTAVNDPWNIGTFALQASEGGLAIVIR